MPVATIGRTFRFESAHFLPKVPEGHRCKRLHGHNYKVELIVTGEIDDRGFVKDFGELDAYIAPLLAKVDHHLLNDVPGLDNPTAEIIARWFLDQIPGVTSVKVWENDDCWAVVSR